MSADLSRTTSLRSKYNSIFLLFLLSLSVTNSVIEFAKDKVSGRQQGSFHSMLPDRKLSFDGEMSLFCSVGWRLLKRFFNAQLSYTGERDGFLHSKFRAFSFTPLIRQLNSVCLYETETLDEPKRCSNNSLTSFLEVGVRSSDCNEV